MIKCAVVTPNPLIFIAGAGEWVQAPDYSANLGFVHEVVEDLKRIFTLIPRKDLPMVVFIDDLDRCSPGKVAAVVEAINLFLAGEFPDCMFVLGIDDEMIAAALDKAHSEVIAKIPAYARSSSIGWRFMDKFVQLPFAIPPPTSEDLAQYVDSLLSKSDHRSGNAQDALDYAARVVEQHSASSITAEEVVRKVATQQNLDPDQQETLKKEVKIIQDMNENIKRFTDREESIRLLMSSYTKEFFSNPRDMKRFVNLFRFYYFLRAARQARGEAVVSVEQLSRWLVLSLRWPEVIRWLRRQPNSKRPDSEAPLTILENTAGVSRTFAEWQDQVGKASGLDVGEALWLSDKGFYEFFRKEHSMFSSPERLSSCRDAGMW